MKNVVLCGHTGNFNRGCEAIIKSTADLFKDRGVVSILGEHRKKDDSKYGYDEFCKIVEYAEFNNMPLSRALGLFFDKVLKKTYTANRIRQRKIFSEIKNSNIALNVGGDTYCYGRHMPSEMLNLFCERKNLINLFWAFSIHEVSSEDRDMMADIARYKYVFPRESVTYNTLVNGGIDKSKIILTSDPAFTLKPEKVDLPDEFKVKNTVGINLSPIVSGCFKDLDLAYNNYYNLIDYVLNNTDMNVALIPHVYEAGNYNEHDLRVLSRIHKKYQNNSRVFLIDMFYTCRQLKYIISNLRFLITARTHASIAAYSSYVPTIVLGYSSKARGISMDLFGTCDNYVFSVQDISDENEVLDCFKYMCENEDKTIEILKESVPVLQKRVEDSVDFIVNKLIK